MESLRSYFAQKIGRYILSSAFVLGGLASPARAQEIPGIFITSKPLEEYSIIGDPTCDLYSRACRKEYGDLRLADAPLHFMPEPGIKGRLDSIEHTLRGLAVHAEAEFKAPGWLFGQKIRLDLLDREVSTDLSARRDDFYLGFRLKLKNRGLKFGGAYFTLQAEF